MTNIAVNTKAASSTAEESTSGRMAHATKVNFARESDMDRAVGGQPATTLTYTSAPTTKTKRQATEGTSGRMDACTKEGSQTTSSKSFKI